MPDGVMVAQQTLNLLVMVQVHVGQPTHFDPFFPFRCRSKTWSMENRGCHSYELEPNFFSAERPHKPNERRYVSFICHRSSGVAARLRA